MSLDKVVECLKALPLGRRENSPTSSDESDTCRSRYARRLRDDASQSKGAESVSKFFCIEDTFASDEIKVSVDNVGPIKFPIEEETIKKLISVSEKAKYGRGTKTILDVSYRDTQTIPASKLEVDIDQESLQNVLKHVEAELNIDESSKLELHLYNMLIYGKGQFFKKHRDSEKVPNMVATLVIVLPSAHTGGDLIIYHGSSKHKFFGSANHKVIKCVTFYADCYHEVKEVTDGYRVALTYNVAVKSETIPGGGVVNESLREAVNNFFRMEKDDNLVYLLDHQYTEQSLRWYLLKGSDQTRAKALLAVAKREGYLPFLALMDYHESWDQESTTEAKAEKETDLYCWIDENNQRFEDIDKIHSNEIGKICFTKDTKECFEPEGREEEGPTGNEGNWVNQWYRRSCVVLWRSTWSYRKGFETNLAEFHPLTTQPGMQNTLLKKIKDNEQGFFTTRFWRNWRSNEEDKVKKMILDIAIYLSDMEMIEKILKNFEPSDIFDFKKVEMVTWVSNTWNIKLYKNLVDAWKTPEKLKESFANDWYSSYKLKELLTSLLPFLEQYMTKEDKNIEIVEYLLNETADFFEKTKKEYNWGSDKKRSSDQNLCSLLQISHELGKLDLEEKLLKHLESLSLSDVARFNMFEKELHPDQFAKVSGKLLLTMTDNFLKRVWEEKYIYAEPKKTYIEEICSLFECAVKIQNQSIEAHILNHMKSNRATFNASFLAELFVNMKNVLGNRVNCYPKFKTHVLSLVNEELGKLNDLNDWKLPLNISCKCQYCRQMQDFLASSTSSHVKMVVSRETERHISNNLRVANDMPISFISAQQNRKTWDFMATKKPKLLEDRRNYIKRLMICRKMILDLAQEVPGTSAAKKAKK